MLQLASVGSLVSLQLPANLQLASRSVSWCLAIWISSAACVQEPVVWQLKPQRGYSNWAQETYITVIYIYIIYIYILYILISRSWSILPFTHPFWFGLNRQPFLTVPKCLVVVLTVVHAVQAAGFVFVPRQIWRKFYLVKFDHFINKSLNNYNYECKNNCSRTSYNKCSWFKLPSGCFGGWFFTSC